MSDLSPPTQDAAPSEAPPQPGAPQLIFTAERESAALLELLRRPGVLETLAGRGYGVALGLERLDDGAAEVARLLAGHADPLVAWIKLPPEEGYALNLRNYPQALARYRDFRAWAQGQRLHFHAVALEMAAPPDVADVEDLTTRHMFHRLRLATEQGLYTAGRAAYIELFALMRQDGYEVHTFQLPFVADDRRAGTTLIQRALDVIDLPADVDVLSCSSAVPIESLRGDLGGALIASYGPAADAIALGGFGDEHAEDGISLLPWPALRRDLLLAAAYTDTIYIETLEGCVERELLPLMAALDWRAQVQPWRRRRALIAGLRALILLALLGTRFGPRALAWSGWALAALLWLRGRRRGRLQRVAADQQPGGPAADADGG